MKNASRLRVIPFVCLFLLMVPAQRWMEQRLKGMQDQAKTSFLPPEAYHLPPVPVLRALSLGYNELLADLLWVRTIIYFADHHNSDKDLRHTYRYLNAALGLDEHFEAVYRYGAAMMMSRRRSDSNEDVWAAIGLLKRAHQLYPDNPNYPLYVGAYYLSELHSKDNEERARWLRQGADWVRRAALVGVGLSWLPSLAAKIYTEQGRRDLAIRHLEELYLTTQDKEMKAQIAAKLKHLHAKAHAQKLKKAAKEFSQAYRSSGLTFVPPDLFVLLHSDPVPPYTLGSPLFQTDQQTAQPDQ